MGRGTTRAGWTAVAVVAAALFGAAIALFVAGLRLDETRGLSHAEHASVLQAFAAAGALAGTAALVAVTGYYAWVTARTLHHAGPIISVDLKQAWVGPGGAVTVPLEQGIATTSPIPEYPKFMFAIEVGNSGGTAVTIDKAAVEMEKGTQYWQPEPPVGPTFPHRLDSHAGVTFFVDPAAVGAAIQALRLKEEVGAIVTTGAKEVHRSPRTPLRPQT